MEEEIVGYRHELDDNEILGTKDQEPVSRRWIHYLEDIEETRKRAKNPMT